MNSSTIDLSGGIQGPWCALFLETKHRLLVSHMAEGWSVYLGKVSDDFVVYPLVTDIDKKVAHDLGFSDCDNKAIQDDDGNVGKYMYNLFTTDELTSLGAHLSKWTPLQLHESFVKIANDRAIQGLAKVQAKEPLSTNTMLFVGEIPKE